MIDHESFGTPSGVLNVMKGLELFLDAQGQTENPDAEYLEGVDGKRRMQELKEAAGLSGGRLTKAWNRKKRPGSDGRGNKRPALLRGRGRR